MILVAESFFLSRDVAYSGGGQRELCFGDLWGYPRQKKKEGKRGKKKGKKVGNWEKGVKIGKNLQIVNSSQLTSNFITSGGWGQNIACDRTSVKMQRTPATE